MAGTCTAMGWTCILMLAVLSLLGNAQAQNKCIPEDEATLLELKMDFSCQDINPGVICPFDSWVAGTDCCTDWTGITCDSQGRVTKIKIDSYFRPQSTFGVHSRAKADVFGQSLPKLKELQDIEINFVSLALPLPKWWGSITKLRRLYLLASNIVGEIPREYGKLSNLEIFHVDTVSPDYFGNGMVGTSGIPRELCNLHKLKEFFLFFNPKLSGGFPTCIDGWTSIEVISITNGVPGFGSAGGMTGSLPATIGKLSNLRELRLSFNNFGGEIPKSITNLRKLTVLRLDHNRFAGCIPAQIGYMKALQAVDFHSNRMYGLLPDSIASLPDLAGLDLGNNSFWGGIPSSIYNMPRLGSLILNNNRMWGRIPPYVGQADAMKFFQMDVSHNYLSGPLPPTLKHNLFYLDISYNSFYGSIPKSIGDLIYLRELDMSNNKFSGRIPAEIANPQDLFRLDVSYNKLTGPVPPPLKRIPDLNLAGNNVTGYP